MVYIRKNTSFGPNLILGNPGFLVFAPFYTSIDHLPLARRQTMSKPVSNGIMLNLGWVPADKKDEISVDPPVEEFEAPADHYEINEGKLNYKIEYIFVITHFLYL